MLFADFVNTVENSIMELAPGFEPAPQVDVKADLDKSTVLCGGAVFEQFEEAIV